jgi:hypothetical protein
MLSGLRLAVAAGGFLCISVCCAGTQSSDREVLQPWIESMNNHMQHLTSISICSSEDQFSIQSRYVAMMKPNK